MNALNCESVARAALGEPLKREGTELVWRCPHPERHANGDAHPSLKVNSKKDVFLCGPCGAKGKAWALAAFLAGCDSGDKSAVKAWLEERGLLSRAQRKVRAGGRGPVVATFVHEDTGGHPVCRKRRHEPGAGGHEKDYTWERFEDGQWKLGLGSPAIIPPLYRLPHIKAEPLIFLFESHTDVERAVKMGLAATTSGGADSWRKEYADALAGKDVCLIPDNDVAGRGYAKKVCASLAGKSRSLKVVSIAPYPDFRRWAEASGTQEKLLVLYKAAPEWKPTVIDPATLLDSIEGYIRRFVSLSRSQARVAALWIIHAYTFTCGDATPYLAITSPEKRSGKTRLLEVFETLVANPWLTGRATAAVLSRKIDAEQPTLLLDESDAAFNGEKEYSEVLRGVLDTGHRKNGKTTCCVGQGANISYRDFSTFCPKAIAGIEKLPDTVADRAIPIRLKRAARGECVERFRLRNVASEAAILRDRIETWATLIAEGLSTATPELPEALNDRQQDGAEPLLAIADAAGREWPYNARLAIVELCSGPQASDESVTVRLLSDIRATFQGRGVDKISSADLVTALVEIETSPWAEWSHGKPLTAPKLARLLSKYDISSENTRFGEKVLRGYEKGSFADAWGRYLSPHTSLENAQAPENLVSKRYSATTRINTSETLDFESATSPPCSTSKNTQVASKGAPRSSVAVSKTPTGMEEEL